MKIKETEEKKENVNKEISKIIDKKTSTRVFRNLIIAIAIMAYFCVMAKVYENVQFNGITSIMKVATAVFLVITIVLIEIAYKKESKRVFIHSMEMLALAVHSLTTIYVIRINNFDFPKYILFSSFIFSIFFVLKTIIINTKARKDYLKELSDISNIVKKDEPVVKEAKKKNVEEDDDKIDEADDVEEKIENKEEIKEEIKEKSKEVINKDDGEYDKNVLEVDKMLNKEENKEEEPEKKFSNKRLADIRAKLKELQKKEINIIDKNKDQKENDKKEEKIEIKEEDSKEEKPENIEVTAKKKTTRRKTTKKEENNTEEDKVDDNNEVKEEKKKKTTKAKKTKTTNTKKEEKSDEDSKADNEEVKEENEEKKEASKKKRGRPKKEVKVND